MVGEGRHHRPGCIHERPARPRPCGVIAGCDQISRTHFSPFVTDPTFPFDTGLAGVMSKPCRLQVASSCGIRTTQLEICGPSSIS